MPPRRGATQLKPSSADELAAQLASKLTIKEPTLSRKEQQPPLTKVSAMKAINEISQSLSQTVKSGWKASTTETKKQATTTISQVKGLVTRAERALDFLRNADGVVSLDVERAAASLVSKLAHLELYDLAAHNLEEARSRIVQLYPFQQDDDNTNFLSLPLPSDPISCKTLLTLISTHLTYAITVASNTRTTKALSDLLFRLPTILEWGTLLSTSLPAEHCNTTLTRVYSTLVKHCAQSPEEDVDSSFRVRHYALLCLIQVSGLEAESYWGQVLKATSVYLKMKKDEVAAANGVHAMYASIVNAAVSRKEILSGATFDKFCQTWVHIGQKTGTLSILDSIRRKLASICKTSDGAPINPTQITAILKQACVALEQRKEHSDSDPLFEEAREALQLSLETLDQHDREVILKTVLTLRGHCTLTLEREIGGPTLVHDLLVETINSVENNLGSIAILRDACTQILDSLFVLSSIHISAPGPTSYVSAFKDLDRATKIIHTEFVTTGVTPSDRANYARCISSAAHNHSVKLYQQGSHSAAIKFLECACTLGEEGLQLRSMAEEDTKEDPREQKRWQSLQESIYRRWELLGVCYSKTGDRAKMFESFVRSVLSFPFAESSIETEASKSPIPLIYASTPALQQLGVLVERVTVLGALDLGLQAAAVCVSSPTSRSPNSSAIKGVLLEKQIDCLDISLWREHFSLLLHLMTSLLEIYTPLSMPLRRARVLLRMLEFLFHVDLPATHEYKDYTAIAAEVESLCSVQGYGQDAELQRFKPHFLCTSHLWLVLHTYKNGASETQSLEEVSQHSLEETCTLLRTIYRPVPTRAASPVMKPLGSTKRKIAPRKVGATKTPSRGKAIAVKETNSPNDTSSSQPSIDPSLRLFSLLESASNLASLLGLTLLNVNLLHTSLKVFTREGLQEEHAILGGMLADQLIRLGKHKRAKRVLQEALASANIVPVSEEASVPLHLLYAWVLTEEGAVTESASTYRDALSLADRIPPEDKNGPTNRRILQRVGALERAALAAQVFSCIQDHRADPQHWLKGLQQSIRLWNRALDALSRLKNRPQAIQPSESDENSFFSTGVSAAPPPDQEAASRVAALKTSSHRTPVQGVEWRITAATFRCLLHLADSYLRRGLPRESEFFSQQALDLADALGLPATVSAAWARKARVQLLQGLPGPCHVSIEQGEQSTGSITGLEAAELIHIQGELSRRTSDEGAGPLYESAAQVLLNLEESFNVLENARKSMLPTEASPAAEILGAEMLAAILADSIWLLRRNADEQFSDSLESMMRLPQRPRIKLLQDALMAKLTLHDVYQLLQSDMFLSSIPDSTIALPLEFSPASTVKGSSSLEISQVLDTAEELFWNNLARILPHGSVARVRETMLTLALVKSLQCSLRKESKGLTVAAARLLDAGSVVSLRRDMVDAINSKLDIDRDHSSNDLTWTHVNEDGSPSPPEDGPKVTNSTRMRGMLNFPNDHHQMEVDHGTSGGPMQEHWEAMREKHNSFQTDQLKLSTSQSAHLPQTWTVIHINISPDGETMFLSRQRGMGCGCDAQGLSTCPTQQEPLIFCIPLRNRRDQNEAEEGHLSVEFVNEQLAELIRLSDENSRSGGGLRDGGDIEARRNWWRQRAELDEKMKGLLENIEFSWFGAFKTIFNMEVALDDGRIDAIRSHLSKVFERGLRLRSQEKKRSRSRSPSKRTDDPHIFPLNDRLLRCFATLSPKCPNEELEDLIYFVLDLYQHQGVPFAISEVDIDSMAIDLRAALEEVSLLLAEASPTVDRTQDHLFLVLGKDLQSIPWESVPTLRGRSVSRIPSIDFLYDQLAYFAASKPESVNQPIRRIDARSTYYILNPGGDLKKTEARFRPWLKEMETVGWTGICGAVPTEHDMLTAMENKDLVMYFGHGGGEQYVRSHKVKSLSKCASAMLWGCSSGALRDMGEFDRTGNPYTFMLAGCPLLVANLWDVTDGDIDRFSQSVFDKLGLTAKQLGGTKKRKLDSDPRSVSAAVSGSRNACKLKYLTGAAPVVYGIPIYL